MAGMLGIRTDAGRRLADEGTCAGDAGRYRMAESRAESRWAHGGPGQPETGIAPALAAYAARGGQLLGARRWLENPLMLTHVRWQGADGYTIDAFRRPGDETGVGPEEKEIWVQLALHCPVPQVPSERMEEAPWLPILIDPARVGEFARLLRRDRATARPEPRLVADRPPISGTPYTPPAGALEHRPAFGGSRPREAELGAGSEPAGAHWSAAGHLSNPRDEQHYPTSTPLPPDATHGHTPFTSDASAWTGGWQQNAIDAPEVNVLPSVEIELPALLGGPATVDYTRDFARDVATHFGRACRMIPQVREMRGWMRGDRMVLAARMAVASGTRAPSRAEMEGAAQILADALARRTLPYSRMSFADPGAWASGTPLPD